MGRPRQALVSRELATRRALEIIDSEGLDALTFDRVAATMNVRGPSLYHHFEDKDDLLREVTRLILRSVPWPPEPVEGSWEDWQVELALRFHRTLLQHRNAAPLMLRFFPRTVMASRYERGSQVLRRFGVPVELHLLLFEGLDKLAIGSALYAAQFPEGDVREGFVGIDPERDVTLDEVLRATPWSGEELLAECLRSFIRGALQAKAGPALSRSRKTGARPPRRAAAEPATAALGDGRLP